MQSTNHNSALTLLLANKTPLMITPAMRAEVIRLANHRPWAKRQLFHLLDKCTVSIH